MLKCGKLFLVFLLAAVLCLPAGCGVNYTGNPDNDSTSCGNITMGEGKFAYADGVVYFADFTNVYEYDTETGKIVILDAKSDDVRSIYVQDDYIYFACKGLRRLSRDGKKVQQVMEWEEGCLQLYIEDSDAYYLAPGIEGSLYHRNLEDGAETELLKDVLAYYVDDTNLYAVADKDEIPCLFVGDKEKRDLSVQELSFSPIEVFASEDGLYLSEWELTS